MNETMLTLVGNLTADPELRYTKQGVPVARLRVASTPRTYDKARGEYVDGEPLYLTCSVWKQPAENVTESLTRGARVVVTGRLRMNSWETPEGEKRSAWELDVDEIGPSLRFAVAKPEKAARGPAKPKQADSDGWGAGEPPF